MKWRAAVEIIEGEVVDVLSPSCDETWEFWNKFCAEPHYAASNNSFWYYIEVEE